MIDVFIRSRSMSSGQSMLRRAMYEVTLERWHLEYACVRTVWNMGIREGRMFAEQQTRTDLYIVTDDDVLIVGKDWLKRGRDAMLAHPEYAICSSLSLIEGENLAVPPPNSGAIYDMHAVGAPMWIRQGIIKEDLPDLTLDQECGIIHKYVSDKGYKEGLITGLRHSHLGHGFSSNPALHWGM